MEGPSILVHGYSRDEARAIAEAFGRATGRRVGVISGSSLGDALVGDILRHAPSARFEEDPRKAVVFLGFDDEQVYDCMMAFPDESRGIKRPAFAYPTEDSVKWTLDRLLGQLMAHRDGRDEDG